MVFYNKLEMIFKLSSNSQLLLDPKSMDCFLSSNNIFENVTFSNQNISNIKVIKQMRFII
jgi:hypothetical protein